MPDLSPKQEMSFQAFINIKFGTEIKIRQMGEKIKRYFTGHINWINLIKHKLNYF